MHQVRYVSVWFAVYNVLLVWCDEWVMHSMMQCVTNGWYMGDAWVVWCVMGMNEWMNERVNEWINERMGNVEWLCILLYLICICNMPLYLFRAISYMTNKPHIQPRTSVGNSSHRTRLVTYIFPYLLIEIERWQGEMMSNREETSWLMPRSLDISSAKSGGGGGGGGGGANGQNGERLVTSDWLCLMPSSCETRGCFTNVSRALKNNLAKIYIKNAWLWAHAQSFNLKFSQGVRFLQCTNFGRIV